MKDIVATVFAACIVTQAMALKCFVCESGDAKRPNMDCPVEGQVAYPKLPLVVCQGKCYIRTKKGKGGAIVQRGCLPTTWLKRYLKDGCDVVSNDIWCFCSHTGCNGRRLGQWFPII